MKFVQIANLLVCVAILLLLIFLPDGNNKKGGESFWAGIKPSPATLAKIQSEEMDFTVSNGIMRKLRDTLELKLGADYYKLHTGGVRFSFADIKGYMETIREKGEAAGLSDDSIKNLSIYICPGVYPSGSTHPTSSRDVSYKLTSFLFVPLKGTNIFNATTRNLDINQSMFLTAYNWGSLEP